MSDENNKAASATEGDLFGEMPEDVRAKIQALKAEHNAPKLRVFCYGEDTWIALRPANYHEIKNYRSMLFDKAERVNAIRTLFKAICVYPALGPLLEEFPTVPEASVEELQHVIGWRETRGKDF